MFAEPIAVQMATRSTHRRIHEPERERTLRRRRATARLLQAIAVRLDPPVREPRLS
jgi:hypothetical protein